MPLDVHSYHADHSRLSASMMKVLLRSPAEFHARYIAHTIEDKPTSAMILGSAVDCLVTSIEEFGKRFYEALDGRTTEGKAQRKERENYGSVPLTKEQTAKASRMYQALLNHHLAGPLIQNAEKQKVIEWEEDGISMKAMLDLYIPRPNMNSDLVLDIKTCEDPTPEVFGRGGPFGPISKYRYDMQLAHYSEGVQHTPYRPCDTGIIAVGSGDVPDVYCYSMECYMEIGKYWRKKAIEIYKQCSRDNRWMREEQTEVVVLRPSNFDMPLELC